MAFIASRWKWFVAMVIVATMVSAWQLRFVQDDAFISFRYADHLARGLGLVWNPGEPVEGYTNFLWVLLLTLPHRLALDPILFSYITGLFLMAGTMLCAFLVAERLLQSRGWAFAALVALGMNFSFRAFATGGLETALQTFLLTAGLWCALTITTARRMVPRLLLYSAITSAALLTRLDAAVAFAIPTAFVVLFLFRHHRSRFVLYLATLLLPAALILTPWLLWKFSYYGSLLPNTYAAKVRLRAIDGLEYVLRFFLTSMFLPFLVALVFTMRRIIRQRPSALIVLLTIIFWITYLVWIGGDFMEFRFFVPIIPLFVIVFALQLRSVKKNAFVWAAAAGLVLLGPVYQAHVFNAATKGAIMTIHELGDQLIRDKLIVIGTSLRPLASIDPPVSIATMAAGAIPYYATLPTVDMLGLNDPWVIAHGHKVTGKPGHERVAPLSYLIDRRITLVMNYPRIAKADLKNSSEFDDIRSLLQGDLEKTKSRFLCECETDPIPTSTRILLFPISDSEIVPLLYLTDHPGLNHYIQKNGLITFSVYPETIERPNSLSAAPDDLAAVSFSR